MHIPFINVVRRSYTPNLEGAAVAVVMEFLSDTEGGELSVRSTPPYGKLYYYYTFAVFLLQKRVIILTI
ncbi:MAG: hypothetical protein KME55_18870 [Nostoc indistinguendum CM1-VF10]|nr:hypothetical protein [Nostoc indistinguendum CM1-VF10]